MVDVTDKTLIIEFTECSIEHPVIYFGIRNRVDHSLTCNVLCDGKKYPLTTCIPLNESGLFTRLSENRDEAVAKALKANPAYNLSAHIHRRTLTIKGRTIDAVYPHNMTKYDVDISVVLAKNYHIVENVRVHLPRVIIEGEPSEKAVAPSSTANVIDTSSSNVPNTVTENKSDEDTNNNHE